MLLVVVVVVVRAVVVIVVVMVPLLLQRGEDKYLLAEAEIVRDDDSMREQRGCSMSRPIQRLHKPGDLALGYHLITAQVEEELGGLFYALPDVILVKKAYREQEAHRRVIGRRKGQARQR